jgi:pentatricopeptide repeat domain-containing protein 1
LISGWCKVKDVDKAMCLLNEMVNEGLYPDVVTLTTLVGGFCEVGKPLAAKELFFKMKEYGMVNLLACTVVLDGLIKCHFRFEAMLLFRAMEESDLDLDIVVYNIMIDGLCKDGKVSDTRKVLARLLVKGLSFDSYTYNIMIGGLCREGLLDDAEDLLRKMEENGCTPNACSYNVFVQGLLRKRDFLRSRKYLQIMKVKGFVADATTTELLIGFYSADKESSSFQEFLHN